MYISIKQGKEPGFKADKETALPVSQIRNPQKLNCIFCLLKVFEG